MKKRGSFSVSACAKPLTISLLAWILCACSASSGPSITLNRQTSATPPPTAAPTLTFTPNGIIRERIQIFETVWNTVDTTFYDPDFGGLDWNAVHEEYAPLITQAEDEDTFYQLLNQMLWELNVSHVGVGPKEAWPSVEPVAFENGEIGVDVRLLDGQAVITRVETGSSAEKAGLRAGFVIQSIGGKPVEQLIAEKETSLAPPYNQQSRTDQLTRGLLSLIYGSPGECISLAYLDERDDPHEQCIQRLRRARVAYMGGVLPPSYLEIESMRLEGGVGYIRFNSFHADLIPDLVESVAALQDAPGIIVDLRGNPGGDPVTCEKLAAQFLEGRVAFGVFKARGQTIPRQVIGENVYTGPLIVLIDALSYSGSEYFSGTMQVIGRAVVVGEQSPGGLTAMNVAALPDDIILGFPVAQLVLPGGEIPEGRGITPDISVSLDREQMLKGIDAQLEAAIDYVHEHGQNEQ